MPKKENENRSIALTRDLDELWIVLGGTGNIGQSLKRFAESESGLELELVGRSHPFMAALESRDISQWQQEFSATANKIKLIVATGGGSEDNRRLAGALSAIDLTWFTKIILFSSLSAEPSSRVYQKELLSKRNDFYGKRFLELTLAEKVVAEHLLILRLGRVVGCNSIWDEALSFGHRPFMPRPPAGALGQLTPVDTIFEMCCGQERGIVKLYFEMQTSKAAALGKPIFFIGLFVTGMLAVFNKKALPAYRYFKLGLDR